MVVTHLKFILILLLSTQLSVARRLIVKKKKKYYFFVCVDDLIKEMIREFVKILTYEIQISIYEIIYCIKDLRDYTFIPDLKIKENNYYVFKLQKDFIYKKKISQLLFPKIIVNKQLVIKGLTRHSMWPLRRYISSMIIYV